MRTSEAVNLIEKALTEQAHMLSGLGPDTPQSQTVQAALRDRIALAETALNRADGITIQRWEPLLPQLYLAVRTHLSREELAEWNRLARLVSQTLTSA